MDTLSNLRVVSFNCAGVKNKLPIVRDLCDGGDIIFMQETLLTPVVINTIDNVHPEFSAASISSMHIDRPRAGRPSGGLSILWRRSMTNVCGTRPIFCTLDDVCGNRGDCE